MKHSRRRSRPARLSRGFTLLEVTVAFALLALALTLLLGALSGAARQIRHSEEISRASLHAQSLLAGVDAADPLDPGSRHGVLEQGRYRWTLEIAPYADAVPGPATPGLALSPQLRQLTLEMRWGEGKADAMRWQTLRLVPAGAPP